MVSVHPLFKPPHFKPFLFTQTSLRHKNNTISHCSQFSTLSSSTMAAGLSAAITMKPLLRFHQPRLPKPIPTTLPFSPLRIFHHTASPIPQNFSTFTVCVLMQDPKQGTQMEIQAQEPPPSPPQQVLSQKLAEKLARKESESFTYLIAAVMSSFGITSMAVFAVYYRFAWQMEVGGDALKLIFFFLFLRKVLKKWL